MKIYLVGGAVRDLLLGLNPKDKDYVVVGETPEKMLSLGYQQVGADFPVFLHPETQEEYALARIERKVGLGYNGFTTDFNSSVTLEEDLYRRDLTINAMAIPKDGSLKDLIDPYNGKEDLKNGIIRHVSEAFSEDPVRVLRVARFAARYGFKVAESTLKLMSDIALSEDFKHLTQERVLLEINKVFKEDNAYLFFDILKDINALKHISNGKYDSAWNNENRDLFIKLKKETNNTNLLLCVLLFNFNDKDYEIYKIDSYVKELSIKYNKYKDDIINYDDLSNEDKVNLHNKLDSRRKFNAFVEIVTLAEFHSNKKVNIIKDAELLNSIDNSVIIGDCKNSKEIGELIKNYKIDLLKNNKKKKLGI